MGEAAFVIKVFIFSCMFVFALQFKVKGVSAEDQIFGYLHDSRAAKWMQDSGHGAVRLTASVVNQVVDTKKISESMKAMKPPSQEEMLQKQMDQMKQQEEEWVRRVEEAVDGVEQQ